MSSIPINDDPNSDTEDLADNSAGDESIPGDSNELTKLRSERDQLYQSLARAQADFQNSRRRLESDKEQAVQYANSTLIKSLLPVIDNFERALGVDSSKVDAA